MAGDGIWWKFGNEQWSRKLGVDTSIRGPVADKENDFEILGWNGKAHMRIGKGLLILFLLTAFAVGWWGGRTSQEAGDLVAIHDSMHHLADRDRKIGTLILGLCDHENDPRVEALCVEAARNMQTFAEEEGRR
ncbi:MAG: hypothetical protein ABSF98_23815 [Bryobacteraceae bacterium]